MFTHCICTCSRKNHLAIARLTGDGWVPGRVGNRQVDALAGDLVWLTRARLWPGRSQELFVRSLQLQSRGLLRYRIALPASER